MGSASSSGMNGRDVRMVQGGKHMSLPLKSGEAIRVAGKGVGQELQRHVAAQLCIPRAIDLAHPACAQGGDDLVGAEATAWGEGHGLRGRIPRHQTVFVPG